MSKTSWWCGIAATGLIAQLANGQVVLGVGNAETSVWLYDTYRSSFSQLFIPSESPDVAGGGPAGLAADDDGRVLYWSNGDDLFSVSYDERDARGRLFATKIADMSNPETGTASHALVGLTFAEGQLYGVDTSFSPEFPTPEGVYAIDVATGVTSIVVDLSAVASAYSISGLAFNPDDGLFYGANDDADAPNGIGLYTIDVLANAGPQGAIEFVSPYSNAAGTNNDIDGLAVGGGFAYLISDEPGAIGVFDLDAREYIEPINSPWASAESLSAGAWASGLIEPPLDNDLVASITPSPIRLVELSELLEYRIRVTNDSLIATERVSGSLTLDNRLEFDSLEGTGTAEGNIVFLDFGDLAPLQSVEAIVRARATTSGSIFSVFETHAEQSDPDNADNVAVASSEVAFDADLGVSIVSMRNPKIGTGEFDVVLRATNTGPLVAVLVRTRMELPEGIEFVGGDVAVDGTSVETTFVAIPPGAAEEAVVRVRATSVGNYELAGDVASILGPTQDPNPGNDATVADVRVVGSVDVATPEVIFSSVATVPSSLVPDAPSERFVSFDRPYRSPSGGSFAIGARTNAPEPFADEVVVLGGGASVVAVREGTLLPSDQAIGPIDTFISIDDEQRIAFATRLSEVGGAADSVLVREPSGELQVVATAGQLLVGLGATLTSPIRAPNVLDDGRIVFDAHTEGPTTSDQFLLYSDGTTVLAHEGETIPDNQLEPGFAWDSFAGAIDDDDNFDAFQVDAAGEHWIVRGDTEAALSSDNVAAFNNTVFAQEGVALDGFIEPVAEGTSTIRHVLSRRNGRYIARGENADGTDWVLLDGDVETQTGAPITPNADERWSDASFSQTFMLNQVNNAGDFLIGGFTDEPDVFRNNVLVLNGGSVVLREGAPVDLDDNNIFDDDAFVSFLNNDDGFITEDRKVYVVATLRNSQRDTIGQALLRTRAEPCRCERDGNTTIINVADLLAYLDGWFVAPPVVRPGSELDFTGDGIVDVADLLGFLDCWLRSVGGECAA